MLQLSLNKALEATEMERGYGGCVRVPFLMSALVRNMQECYACGKKF